ncbi:hypothetical protein N665_0190s0040 [Sinapis alba]|nr:hypothetical protein N665_0190s0040 [Sinapis alba]
MEFVIQKYWIEGKAKKNCFMLYARDPTISLAEPQTNYNWSWFSDLDQASYPGFKLLVKTIVYLQVFILSLYIFVNSDERIEVAKVEWVAWLEVVGNFEMENLTLNSLYEVVFVVKLIDPVQEETKERQENMNMLGRNCWVNMSGHRRNIIQGRWSFSMNEVKGGLWKSGLVVKGVAIRPKN